MAKDKSPSKKSITATSSILSADDERLEKLFDQMGSGSIETLENAARQLITLSTALLGAFFGLLAFKDAPSYLRFVEIKLIGGCALAAFMLSLLLALRAISPREHNFPQTSLTAKRNTLDQILLRKQSSVVWASRNFGVGAFLMLLAALDILIFRI